MAPCNAKDKNQLWTQSARPSAFPPCRQAPSPTPLAPLAEPDPSGGKFIVNAGSNDCLNAVQTGGVTVTTCTQGLMDVQWSYCPPTMKCKGQMISGSTNFCLTVKGTKLTPSQAACSTAKSDLCARPLPSPHLPRVPIDAEATLCCRRWTWKSADEQ